MKNLSLFLITLVILVSAVPANAQRRKRATQPPQPTSEQTPPSGSYRRAKKQAAQKLSVPCTISIADSPYIRGLRLDLGLVWVEYNFTFNSDFVKSNLTSSENGFLNSWVFYAKTPQRPGNIVKKIVANFYPTSESRVVYNFQIQYVDDLAFENEDAIKQVLAENLKIPVGSWVSIPDPEYSKKVLFSFVALLDLRAVPIENLILRQAECNGWRAVFVTSANTTGLVLSITNSSVSDNMDQLNAQWQKAVDDAQKQRTKKIFTP
jgi:hypothetical protein